MKSIVLLAILYVSFVTAHQKRYDDYKLVDVVPSNDEQVAFLRSLMMHDVEIDFWKPASHVDVKSAMMMAPKTFDRLSKLFDSLGLPYIVVDENVQRMIDEEQRELKSAINNKDDDDIDLDKFNPFDKTYKWLDTLPTRCPKSHSCQVYSIGNSHLNVPIKAFKITKEVPNRKSWYLDATTHAREWIGSGTINKIIDHLVTAKDPKALDLINKYDFYFVPIVNPDGYNVSWTTDRMWRKNVKPITAKCIGVDLNRNFASSNWGKEGASNQACAETYMGPSAGSESETISVSKELMRISANTVVFLTLHSYGNMYLLPYGNTINYDGKKCERTKDHDEIMKALNPMADATQATHNTVWKRGNGCEVIYPTTGGTDDYAKEKASIKYSICVELRGNKFILPPSEIHKSFLEVFNGMVELSKYIKH